MNTFKRLLPILLLAVVALAQTGDKKIERPRFLSPNGYAQLATLGAVAVTDYQATNRAYRNFPLARGESNPLLRCGGQRCAGRHAAMDIGLGIAVIAVDRYIAPMLPRRAQIVMRSLTWTGIGFRSAIVIHNYRIGGER